MDKLYVFTLTGGIDKRAIVVANDINEALVILQTECIKSGKNLSIESVSENKFSTQGFTRNDNVSFETVYDIARGNHNSKGSEQLDKFSDVNSSKLSQLKSALDNPHLMGNLARRNDIKHQINDLL